MPWKDFRGVDVVEERGRSRAVWIYVRTASGKRVKLEAPSTTRDRADAQFDDACARLRKRELETDGPAALNDESVAPSEQGG